MLIRKHSVRKHRNPVALFAMLLATFPILLPFLSEAFAAKVEVGPHTEKRVPIPVTGPQDEVLVITPLPPYKLVESNISLQDFGLWKKGKATPEQHIYNLANAYSSQEFVHIDGKVAPPPQSGGGGKAELPPFHVTVPAVDLDWTGPGSPANETVEDTQYVWVTDQTNQSFVVRCPREVDDDMFLWNESLKPHKLPDMKLSWNAAQLNVYTNKILIHPEFMILKTHWGSSGNEQGMDFQVSRNTNAAPNSAILSIRLDRMSNPSDEPYNPGEISGTYDEINCKTVKIELKVQHPQSPGPTGSIAKYAMYPTKGSANNLFSTWPDEPIKIYVQVEPAGFANEMPDSFIKWTANGFVIPDNTLIYEFTWSSTGTRYIILTFPVLGETRKVYVDVPNVGYRTESYALLNLVDFSAVPVIVQTGTESLIYCNHHYADGPLRDAIRHSLWNALSVLSPLVSSDEIYHVTTGHEYDNCHTDHQQAFNFTMDLHNNEVGRTVSFPITTLVTVPRVVEVLEGMYNTGLLWIWEDSGAPINTETNSEGILVKSNNQKIYPIQ